MSINPKFLGDLQGQSAVKLRAPDGDHAVILLQGGQLVSWKPLGADEQLYLSPTSRYGEGTAVRGGVPVVFPQFNVRGPLPKHGFARNRLWTVIEADVRGGHAFAVLRLTDDAETRALWPYEFAIELTVSLGARQIDIELAVTNSGSARFDFMAALHTYLHCQDVSRAQLEGLMDQSYFDHVNQETRTQWVDVVTIAQELDRIYWRAPAALKLREIGRRLTIAQQGFNDTVVWNPGPIACAALPDMPPDDWFNMLCVEAARIGEPITLAPGEEWSGMQTLSLQA